MNFENILGVLGELNLTTKQTLELTKVIMPMANTIMKDEELQAILKKRIDEKEYKELEAELKEKYKELSEEESKEKIKLELNIAIDKRAKEVMLEMAMLLVSKYDSFVYKALAALNGNTVEEVENMKINVVIDQVTIILFNKHIQDFFQSATE